jgi:hypothetical protein
MQSYGAYVIAESDDNPDADMIVTNDSGLDCAISDILKDQKDN